MKSIFIIAVLTTSAAALPFGIAHKPPVAWPHYNLTHPSNGTHGHYNGTHHHNGTELPLPGINGTGSPHIKRFIPAEPKVKNNTHPGHPIHPPYPNGTFPLNVTLPGNETLPFNLTKLN